MSEPVGSPPLTEAMVERMAKAMFDGSVHWHPELTWKNTMDSHRDLFRKYARSAYPVMCELLREQGAL